MQPSYLFSKDLKLSVPASQRVWPEIFMLKMMTLSIIVAYNLPSIIMKLHYFSITDSKPLRL